MSMSMSGWAVAGRGQEPLEQQLVGDRVDVGDLQRVADRRIGRRSPALAQDVVVPAEPGDVVHHEEVARELQLLDDAQFMFYLRICLHRPLRWAIPLRPPRPSPTRATNCPRCARAGTSNGGSCGAMSASPKAHCSPRSAAAVTISVPNSRAISSPTAGGTRRAGPASPRRCPSSCGPGSRAIAMASRPGRERRSAHPWWPPRRGRTARPGRPGRHYVRRHTGGRDGRARY